ncbi:MAG: IS66 family insertion sequence element accessory protein TnpB [Bacteroidales bacterium]
MLNENKFREIYDDYLESGLTIRDYCSNQRMGEAKFYYWQHRLKGLLPPKRGFVPVVFEKDRFVQPVNNPVSLHDQQVATNPVPKPISCEISYPNGVSLKLNGSADLEMIRSLLLLTH